MHCTIRTIILLIFSWVRLATALNVNVSVESGHIKQLINATFAFGNASTVAEGAWIGVWKVVGEYEYEGGDEYEREYEYEIDRCNFCWSNTFKDSADWGYDKLWTPIMRDSISADGMLNVAFQVDYAGDFEIGIFSSPDDFEPNSKESFHVEFPPYRIFKLTSSKRAPTVEIEVNLPKNGGNESVWSVWGADWIQIISMAPQTDAWWQAQYPEGKEVTQTLKDYVHQGDTCWGYPASTKFGETYACGYNSDNQLPSLYSNVSPEDIHAGYGRFYITFGIGGQYSAAMMGEDGWFSWGTTYGSVSVCDVQIAAKKDYSNFVAGSKWEGKVVIGNYCEDGLVRPDLHYDLATITQSYDMCGWGLYTDVSFSAAKVDADSISLMLPKTGDFKLTVVDYKSRAVFGSTIDLKVIPGRADAFTSSFKLLGDDSAAMLSPQTRYDANVSWFDQYHNTADAAAYTVQVVPISGKGAKDTKKAIEEAEVVVAPFFFSFSFNITGVYELHIKVDGGNGSKSHMKGSPFSVNVAGVGACINDDYEMRLDECSSDTLQRKFSLELKANVTCAEDGAGYPEGVVSCEYTPTGSGPAAVAWAVGMLGAGASLVILIWIQVNKRNPFVRYIQPNMVSLFSFFSAMFTVSPIIDLGEPTDTACLLRIWWYHLSAILLLSTIFARVYKVWVVVVIPRRTLQLKRVGDSDLLRRIASIGLAGATILFVWTLVDPPKRTAIESSYLFVKYSTYECASDGNAFSTVIRAFEVGLIAYGCYLAYLTRSCPPELCDTHSLILVMYNLAFVAGSSRILIEAAGMSPDTNTYVSSIGCLLGSTGALILLTYRTMFKVVSKADIGDLTTRVHVTTVASSVVPSST